MVRKVEIHDAYDLKRWWWRGTDGIPETTWPGVYNRSSLPNRYDYFQLPDWDCYSLSGKSITFYMPDEPWNHIEVQGGAWGSFDLLTPGEGKPGAMADPNQHDTSPLLATKVYEKAEGFAANELRLWRSPSQAKSSASRTWSRSGRLMSFRLTTFIQAMSRKVCRYFVTR